MLSRAENFILKTVQSRHSIRISVDETIETWSYRLQGDIGGEYLVSLTLKAGKVVAINSKQLERI